MEWFEVTTKYATDGKDNVIETYPDIEDLQIARPDIGKMFRERPSLYKLTLAYDTEVVTVIRK